MLVEMEEACCCCRLGLPGKAATGLFFQKELEAFSDLPTGEVMPQSPGHLYLLVVVLGRDLRPQGLSPLCQQKTPATTHPTRRPSSQGHPCPSFPISPILFLPPFISRRNSLKVNLHLSSTHFLSSSLCVYGFALLCSPGLVHLLPLPCSSRVRGHISPAASAARLPLLPLVMPGPAGRPGKFRR